MPFCSTILYIFNIPEHKMKKKSQKSAVRILKVWEATRICECQFTRNYTGQVLSDQVWPDQVWSGRVRSGRIGSGQTWLRQVWVGQVWVVQVWLGQVWSVEILSDHHEWPSSGAFDPECPRSFFLSDKKEEIEARYMAERMKRKIHKKGPAPKLLGNERCQICGHPANGFHYNVLRNCALIFNFRSVLSLPVIPRDDNAET